MDRTWFWVPLAVFFVSRLASGVLLAIGASRQAAIDPGPITANAYKVAESTPESPGYLGVVSNWDGQWFRTIAENGYPQSLPSAGGAILPNEWAFSGGYPMLVRAVMKLGGIEFPVAASLVSMTCFAFALVILYGMVRARMDDYAATKLVLALSFFPSTPIFQVAYTESLSLLLLVVALWALTGRRYSLFLVVALALAVTRPLMLPLAAACALIWLLRWKRRRTTEFPLRERVALSCVALACLVLTGLWPSIAAVSTGQMAAFTETVAAWPGNAALGGAHVNWLTLGAQYPLTLGAAVVPVIAVALYAAFRRPVRSLPAALRWWGPVYLIYMLAVTKPNAGIVRYLLLSIIPLSPLLEQRSDNGRAAVVMQWVLIVQFVLIGLVGQYFWVMNVFTIDRAPELQFYP